MSSRHIIETGQSGAFAKEKLALSRGFERYARITGYSQEEQNAPDNLGLFGNVAPDHCDFERIASGTERTSAVSDGMNSIEEMDSIPDPKMKEAPRCSDHELFTSFRNGEDDAFRTLYERHKGEIYTYCVRMLQGERAAASDAFQETFIKAFERAEMFRTGTNVQGWLYRIARNTCLNIRRAEHVMPVDPIEADFTSFDRRQSPEFGEEQNFLREKLEQALSSIAVEFREPFILREFDGFSYVEIARITETSLAVTKVRIFRAKQRMRELLRPYFRDEPAPTDKP